MQQLILLACLLQAAFAAPQFLTFKDGKVGVNFGGYHAEAGLGGLLTGNAAHGGLSASAGTPFGQRAGAGLGGSVNGNSAGLLYAGAEATPQVGAGALLAGDTGVGGFGGSTAYANGKSVTNTITHTRHNSLDLQPSYEPPITSGPATSYDGIQRVKPPKKHLLIKPSDTHEVNKNHNNEQQKTATSAGVNIGIAATAGISVDTGVHHNHYDGKAAVDSILRAATTSRNNVGNQKESFKYAARGAVKSTTINAQDVQHNSATAAVSGGSDAPSPVIIVNRQQRLRQKSRKRQRHQHPRSRERVVQVERLRWAAPPVVEQQQQPAIVNADSVSSSASLSSSHTTQYQASASTNVNANADVNVAHSKHVIKHVEQYPAPSPASGPLPEVHLNVDNNVVHNALNIPINILRAIQDSLNGFDPNHKQYH